ncbi:MAG: hypothetical protein ABSE18_00735 [Minisyncoccia bacterium]|jgi:hypothetical protein
MITITTQQARNRWDYLTEALRFALFSDVNADFIMKTCEQEHLPLEKGLDVLAISGYVLLGFLHPEDLAGELKDELNLDIKICTPIAAAINSRVFSPLRQDIDKVYEPLSKLAAGPKIIRDVGPVPMAAKPAAPIAPAPKAEPVPTPKMSDVGWSQAMPKQPAVKLGQAATPPPVVPRAPAAPAPLTPTTIPPTRGPIGEFERLAVKRSEGIVPPAPLSGTPKPSVPPIPPAPSRPATPVAPPPGPAPLILHEDTSAKPQQRAPDFHFDLPSEKFTAQKGSASLPIRPAVVEFGKVPPPPAPKTVVSTPRVVHYTEYKSPSPENPTPSGPAAQRKITELTATPSTQPSTSLKTPVLPTPLKALPSEPTAPELPMPPKFPTTPTPPVPPPPPSKNN